MWFMKKQDLMMINSPSRKFLQTTYKQGKKRNLKHSNMENSAKNVKKQTNKKPTQNYKNKQTKKQQQKNVAAMCLEHFF